MRLIILIKIIILIWFIFSLCMRMIILCDSENDQSQLLDYNKRWRLKYFKFKLKISFNRTISKRFIKQEIKYLNNLICHLLKKIIYVKIITTTTTTTTVIATNMIFVVTATSTVVDDDSNNNDDHISDNDGDYDNDHGDGGWSNSDNNHVGSSDGWRLL